MVYWRVDGSLSGELSSRESLVCFLLLCLGKCDSPDGLLFVEDNPSASMTLMGMLMLSSQYFPPL